MRPAPRQSPPRDSSGRIIYLGDVRRRRRPGRQEPDRHYLAATALVAIAAWAVWIAVVLTVAPVRLLTYLAFFLPLAIALAATSTIGFYAIEWKRGVIPLLGRCARRGALLSAAAVANLALLAAQRWSLLVLSGLVALAVVLDVGLSWRARR